MRAKTSDDPSLKDLDGLPNFRKFAQQEHLDLKVTSWRLQYITHEYEGNLQELRELHVSTLVPREFRSEFESVDVRIYVVVRNDASSETDPAPLGRVVNGSGVLDVYLPLTVSTFDSLTSCLQAQVEETHDFVIRISTEHSLKELRAKGFLRVIDVILDFVEIDETTGRSPTASPQVLKAEQAITMLHSIRAALWLISALALIAITTKMFA